MSGKQKLLPDLSEIGAGHDYFDSLTPTPTHWCDVADAGEILIARLLDIDPDVEIEADSPISNVASGIAAAAAYGVYSAIAICLGTSREAILGALAPWDEGIRTDAISYEQLRELVKEEELEIAKLRNNREKTR